MLSISNYILLFVVLVINDEISALSFNQLKLGSNATWCENGITFTDNNTLGGSARGFFINNDDTIFVAAHQKSQILIWPNGSIASFRSVAVNLYEYTSLFVTINDDIYFGIGNEPGRIERWTMTSNNTTFVMRFSDHCRGLFVDSYNNLYCSLTWKHRVVKISLNGKDATEATIAGTSSPGAAANELNQPWGIFVDTNSHLYVADAGNNRIQLFRSGQSNGETLAGNGVPQSLTLNGPIDVILDADGYLYIGDSHSGRVIRSGYGGWQCVVGCSGNRGSLSNELETAYSLRFDTRGNLYVADEHNYRIQKFTLGTKSCALSFNQPKLCSNATWYENGITFIDNNTLGGEARGFFINNDDTIFVAAHQKGQILIWSNGSTTPLQSRVVNLFVYTSLFVTINDDIYFENGNEPGRIEKWTMTTNDITFVMRFSHNCYGLFVDIDNNLYCSLTWKHRVVKISLNEKDATEILIAGTGTPGAAANELDQPWGIFVGTNFDLYVADTWNKRIQLFRSGQLNGETVAGNGVPQNLNLAWPTDVVLDADGYLYIGDDHNGRVIRSGYGGWQCIIGCSGNIGSLSNELSLAYSLRFDTRGNLYVADEGNNRIQKFTVGSKSCDCKPPIIALVPSASSLSTPIGFRRGQDFYVTSNLQHRCSQSSSVTVSWTILLCSPICSNKIQLNQRIMTTMNNLFIPSRTLSSGLYEFQITVTMVDYPTLTSSSSTYIEIIKSNIIINFIPFLTSKLIHDYEEDLILSPGQYSTDPNSITFDNNIWNYTYYCRINTTDQQGFRLFDDPNRNCFSNQSLTWKYNTPNNSSLTIAAKSLQLNQTYQFMVQIINQQNSSLQSIGYLFVKIEYIQSPIIIISCIISTMCSPTGTFYYVNPSQLSLYSFCMGYCSTIENLRWNISQGSIDVSNKNSPHIFGLNTKNLTLAKDIFAENKEIIYWHFEVFYSFQNTTSVGLFDIQVNEEPKNGSCSIDPLNGTIITLFTINCSNWFDDDEIKDYSFYAWIEDSSKRMMIGQTTDSIFRLRLPARIDPTALLHIVVQIRDTMGAVTEFHLPSVSVFPNFTMISDLINQLERSNNDSNTNPLNELLIHGDQYTVGQITTSISQIFNEMNNEMIEIASLNGISPTKISITSLNDETFNTVMMNSSNKSMLTEIQNQLNQHAHVREYLMMFINNLTVAKFDDIKFLASILTKLTESTNQLTRKTSELASTKCQQFSNDLKSMATKIPFEDVHFTAIHLAECAINSLNGVNGLLQQRVNTLSLDLIQTNEDLNNCKNDPACQLTDLNMTIGEDDYSSEGSLKKQNLYYQKQKANQIFHQTTDIISSLTSALNIHLNTNQSATINTSVILFSLEKTRTFSSLKHPQIHKFRSNLLNNNTVLIRTFIQPLAFADDPSSQSYTNLSRSFSFSILDENGTEIKIKTNFTDRIEFFIPRDPNLIIPPMILQNVTSIDRFNSFFNFHTINLTQNSNLTFSVHLEIFPLDLTLSYLLIYKFDSKPQWNDHDGWTVFSPLNLTKDGVYIHFIDNNQTANHNTIVYGIRELKMIEMNAILNENRLIFKEPAKFSSDYQIHIYQSGCFYLDSNNNWQSDGLVVGPLTNQYQTHCLSTHLTTFTSALLFLPIPPIEWIDKEDKLTNNSMNNICIGFYYGKSVEHQVEEKQQHFIH